MPVRVHMIGSRGVGSGGVPLLAILLGLVIVVVLAVVMLPLVLIAAGVGVLAVGAMKLRRWAVGGGSRQNQQPVESSDFDSLRAKLEARGTEGFRTQVADAEPEHDSVGMDEQGRRNVRVIDQRQ